MAAIAVTPLVPSIKTTPETAEVLVEGTIQLESGAIVPASSLATGAIPKLLQEGIHKLFAESYADWDDFPAFAQPPKPKERALAIAMKGIA